MLKPCIFSPNEELILAGLILCEKDGRALVLSHERVTVCHLHEDGIYRPLESGRPIDLVAFMQ